MKAIVLGVCFIVVLNSIIGCNFTNKSKPLLDSPVVLQNMFQEPDSSTKAMIQKVNAITEILETSGSSYLFSQKRAAHLLQQAQQSSGIQQVQIYYGYGVELLKAGKTDEAIQIFITIIENLKDAPLENKDQILYDIHKQLAIAYMRKGEQENCIINHTNESCIIPISPKGQHSLRTGSENAILVLNKLLSFNPDDLECQYLLNIANMTLGQYPAQVPEQFRIPESYFAKSVPFPKFSDVAMSTGVAVNELSGGTCVDDFNNDGYLDIIASSWGLHDQIRYFENDKKGGFIDKSLGCGLKGVIGGLNLRHADFNNDGYVDFIILRGAWLKGNGKIPNSLIKNNGDGTFTDVTIESGLYSLHPTQTAVWADFNLDGWLDLFIANESDYENKSNCELFLNNKNGTFANVSATAGITDNAYFKGVTAGDINNDGYSDIYLSVYNGENYLYLNNSNEKSGISFVKSKNSKSVSEPVRSFPAWMFDYNNDGFEDIFVSGYATENDHPADLMMKNIKTNYINNRPRLYENNGDGSFTDVSIKTGLTEPVATMGCNFGDLDNDGFLDFYLATGDPSFFSIVPNRMYRNNRGKKFEDVTYSAGFGHIQKGHAIGFGDFDMDGDQDIYAVMGGAYEGDIFQNLLFENPVGNKNNWISIKLEGTKSNRSAIGAKIIITIVEEGKTRKIYNTVGTGASFGGNSLLAEIGLGKANQIESIEVVWPNKERTTSAFNNIDVNQIIHIKEGDLVFQKIELHPFEFSKMHAHH